MCVAAVGCPEVKLKMTGRYKFPISLESRLLTGAHTISVWDLVSLV